MTTRALVISDTHIADARLDRMPAKVWRAAAEADVILHAGDVTGAALLDALRLRAPVHAVLGNNDHDLRRVLPVRLEVDLDGVGIAMVHDSGLRKGRPARLRRWFPGADVVVFGHSHEPVDEVGDEGQLLFNPGSPTQRRRQPHPTYGVLELAAGQVRRADIVVLT